MTAVILKTETEFKNTTLADEDDTYDYAKNCGAYNCPQTKLPGSLSKTTKKSFAILYGCLLALIGLSVATTLVFMDNIQDHDDEEIENNENVNEKRIANNEHNGDNKSKRHVNLDLVGMRNIKIIIVDFKWFIFHFNSEKLKDSKMSLQVFLSFALI